MFNGENWNRILQHELKSPVSGILSLAQLIMLDAGSNPELRDFAQAIYDRGQKLLTIMENLQDLEKIDRGVFGLSREPLIINNLVEQIQKEYDRALKLKGLSVRVRVQGLPLGTAPLLTFWGKENLLWGIIDNVFRNAFEASPGGATLEFSVALTGDRLMLEVTNEGEVPYEIRDSFFQPFLTTKPKGVGLGTYTIKAFTEALEGTVQFETGSGRTSIRIVLPQHEGQLTV